MRRPVAGFTLIELMIVVVVVAILAGIAVPSYSAYIARGRATEALDLLGAYGVRMEQAYQDVGSYANGTDCRVAAPGAGKWFTLTCAPSDSGQGFTATATGTGAMAGYTYTLNHAGTRATTAHPNGTVANCWSIKGGACDS